MVFSGPARHLTSYYSDCEVSKKVKTIPENQAYFDELLAKQIVKAKTNEAKIYKPFR